MQKTTLVWFRRNLRLSDNAVLQTALAHGLPLAALFAPEHPAQTANPRRAAFHYQAADELAAKLSKKGIPVFTVPGADEHAITALAQRLNAHSVLADEGYTPSEIGRDNRIWRLLDACGIPFVRLNDRTVFAKAELMSEQGRAYTEFAPYRQAWLHALPQRLVSPKPYKRIRLPVQTAFAELPLFPILSYAQAALPQSGGERAAWALWRQFQPDIDFYPILSALPARNATSRLGAYLAAGCISPRLLAQAAAGHADGSWLENLIRRDFYQQLMFHHPETADNGHGAADNAEWFRRWTQGETGFPLIDAAMRCLSRSGWLPPVLRLAAADFWCNILRQSWQQGASWFARVQTDEDEALNIGNWRSVAGLEGAKPPSAANPVIQARRLDPDGTFIRRHIPEIVHLPQDVIHAPWLARADVDRHGYPLPMTDWQAV